jgi:hypothetical protein
MARSRVCGREGEESGGSEEAGWGCCERTDYRGGEKTAEAEKETTPEPGSPAMAPPAEVKLPRRPRAKRAAKKQPRTPRATKPRKKKTPPTSTTE